MEIKFKFGNFKLEKPACTNIVAMERSRSLKCHDKFLQSVGLFLTVFACMVSMNTLLKHMQ